MNKMSIKDLRVDDMCFSFSGPSGDMIISMYYNFTKYNTKGFALVTITKDNQFGELVDYKKFPFISNGKYPIENGSNNSFNEAREIANKYYREESNLWYNIKTYNSLSMEQIEEYRNSNNIFWSDDRIRTEKYI